MLQIRGLFKILSIFKNIKIAPNALIDLKSDPAMGDGTSANSVASYGMLSSTFNFQAAADSYLTRLKQDMYELMEQPLPENLLSIPSGKALKMLYYDLITRCEEKWQAWKPALEWMIKAILEINEVYAINTLNYDATISKNYYLINTTSTPKIGVNTIYNAVINPAFPDALSVINVMPFCWQ